MRVDELAKDLSVNPAEVAKTCAGLGISAHGSAELGDGDVVRIREALAAWTPDVVPSLIPASLKAGVQVRATSNWKYDVAIEASVVEWAGLQQMAKSAIIDTKHFDVSSGCRVAFELSPEGRGVRLLWLKKVVDEPRYWRLVAAWNTWSQRQALASDRAADDREGGRAVLAHILGLPPGTPAPFGLLVTSDGCAFTSTAKPFNIELTTDLALVFPEIKAPIVGRRISAAFIPRPVWKDAQAVLAGLLLPLRQDEEEALLRAWRTIEGARMPKGSNAPWAAEAVPDERVAEGVRSGHTLMIAREGDLLPVGRLTEITNKSWPGDPLATTFPPSVMVVAEPGLVPAIVTEADAWQPATALPSKKFKVRTHPAVRSAVKEVGGPLNCQGRPPTIGHAVFIDVRTQSLAAHSAENNAGRINAQWLRHHRSDLTHGDWLTSRCLELIQEISGTSAISFEEFASPDVLELLLVLPAMVEFDPSDVNLLKFAARRSMALLLALVGVTPTRLVSRGYINSGDELPKSPETAFDELCQIVGDNPVAWLHSLDSARQWGLVSPGNSRAKRTLEVGLTALSTGPREVLIQAKAEAIRAYQTARREAEEQIQVRNQLTSEATRAADTLTLLNAEVLAAKGFADGILCDARQRSSDEASAARNAVEEELVRSRAELAEVRAALGWTARVVVVGDADVVPLPSGPEGWRSFARTLGARGLTYDDAWAARFLLAALAARQIGALVLLAGATGTGKTRIVEETGSVLAGSETRIVPVRPEWLNSSDLLGYVDPIRQLYAPSDFVLAVRDARKGWNPLGGLTPPWFVLLDEMNLARIENYGADVLAVLEKPIESGKRVLQLYPDDQDAVWRAEQGDLTTSQDPVDARRKAMLDRFFHSAQVPGAPDAPASRLHLPGNLVICGTLNTDRHTEDLSPKLLDRSFVLQTPQLKSDDAFAGMVDGAAPSVRFCLPPAPGRFLPEDWRRFPKVRAQLTEVLAMLGTCGVVPSRRIGGSALAYLAQVHALGWWGDDQGTGSEENELTAALIHLLLLPRMECAPEHAVGPLNQLRGWLRDRLAHTHDVTRLVEALLDRATNPAHGDFRGIL